MLAINYASLQVELFGCCKTVPCAPPTCFSTQAAAAAQPIAQTYSATFTLAATTTPEFVIEDDFPAVNASGVALNVAAVPEPQVWVLLAPGLAGIGARRRRVRADR